MKNSKCFAAMSLVLMSFLLSSCEAITTIFNAGMGFGIFAVIAIIMLIVFIVKRVGKSK